MLVVLGVAAKRIWLLLTSFITPNVEGAPGISLGTQGAITDPGASFTLSGSYAPTLPEVMIVIGVISLGGLVFMLLVKALVHPGEKPQKAPAAEPAIA